MFSVAKMRPRNFSEIRGNEVAIQFIKNALTGWFNPITLLHGEAGVGKTTVAKICAKTLTCLRPIQGLACENCENCKKANEVVIGQDRDTANIITFRMSDEGGKIAARKVKDQISTKPLSGGMKVIILEECQGIIKEAQDLLLPAMEYIPDYVKIIMCTTEAKKLQDTFKSRIVDVHFKSPTREQMEKLVIEVATKNGISFESATIPTMIVETSGGKPRECLMSLQKLVTIDRFITSKNARELLNVIDEQLYLEYLTLIRGDIILAIDFTEKLERNGTSLTDFVRGLNNFVLKLITFRYRKELVSADMTERMKRYLKTVSENDILKIQGIIAEKSVLFVNAFNEKSLLISLTFDLSQMNKPAQEKLPNVEHQISSIERTNREVDARQHKKAQEELEHRNAPLQEMNLNALVEGMGASIIKRND